MAQCKTIFRHDLFHERCGDEGIIYIDAWENEKDHSVLEIRGTLLEFGSVQIALSAGIRINKQMRYILFGYGMSCQEFLSPGRAIREVSSILTKELNNRWNAIVDERYSTVSSMNALMDEVERLNQEVKNVKR